MNKTASRRILVTGASSGLNLAKAACHGERGHCVYGTNRKREASSQGAWPKLPLDVCSDVSVKSCVAETKAGEGRIDVLDNNCGHAVVGAMEATDIFGACAQLETSFFGALRIMLAVPAQIREQDADYILNLSSLVGVVPFPFLGVHGASKHALEADSESLDYELVGTDLSPMAAEPDDSFGFHHRCSAYTYCTASISKPDGRLGNDPNLSTP